MSGILYTYPDNFRANKALIAAQYSGANVKVAPDFVFGETNKSDAFLKKFPAGRVPAFETNNGKYITESHAIAYYLANDQLRGKTDLDRAQVMQWMSFADSEMLPAICTWVFPLIGIMPYKKETTKQAQDDLKVSLTILNNVLLNQTFLVGERVTLADICVFCNLTLLYQYALDTEGRKPYGNLNRWFLTILNQPQVRAVLKNFEPCDKATEFDPKKYNDFKKKTTPTAGAGDNKKQEKKEKPKEQKEKAQEPVEEMDAAEEALAAEPKSKDPFAALPKGTFNLEEFKRCYSNEETDVSIPFFWDKFDSENYSIWFGEYKYNDELQRVFMSCNLITGMFQRLDKMRSQSFASVCLFGADNDSTISGVWVWRGQGLAFELSPDWQVDYEVYNWTKLDPKSEETKKLVAQYFAWEGADKQGRKFNQGKIFK